MPKNLCKALTCLLFTFVPVLDAPGGIIFESASLGTTGITTFELSTQGIAGSNVSANVFNGVRFNLKQPAHTSSIGGHFVAHSPQDTFFGAIVQLTDKNDFPDSSNLSTPDVLGSTQFSFPQTSDDAFGDIELILQPGWYGLVFGSGLFGTSGLGAALRNNADINDPNYIAWQLGGSVATEGWLNRSNFPTGFLSGYRFVVQGTIIPEPSSLLMLFSCSVLSLFARRSRVA